MIQIDDYDLPIQVAEKIISGTREVSLSPLMKSIRNAVTRKEPGDKSIEDMYELEEIREIAAYLMVYYNSHICGD